MKTLSLLQPWASLVALGEKQIETRSWKTDYRGPLLIHASKGWQAWQAQLTRDAPFWMPFSLGSTPKELLPWNARGVILCQVFLVDCLRVEDVKCGLSEKERAFGDYTDGRFAWMFEDLTPLKEPIPAKGSLGLWEFDLEGVRPAERGC